MGAFSNAPKPRDITILVILCFMFVSVFIVLEGTPDPS